MKLIMVFLVLCGFTASVAIAAPQLPKGLKWQTNDSDPIYASPKAKKGGTLYSSIQTFPLTTRTVGPDSNTGFRRAILGNAFGSLAFHPNTRNIIPMLATHWAFSKDHKSIFLKLNKKVKWTDGKPLTPEDYIFALKVMRSKDIRAPWYNTYYTDYYDKIVKYDDHTIGIFGKHPKTDSELVNTLDIRPMHKHFYGGKIAKDWVRKYQWSIVPNVGPYYIDKIKKGKSVTFKRKKNWWGENERFFKNRYNVDKIHIKVIRDVNIQYENFKKGKLGAFRLILPTFWHDKAKGPLYDKGYVEKIWFYTQQPQPDMGIWLNMDVPLLKDKNVREGILHSFNIQKVIDRVLRGDYLRAETNTVGYGEYTNTKLRARRFDLKKAEKFFAKAGWSKRGPDGIRVKDGQKMKLRITYGAPHHTERLTVLKEEAKKAGVEFELQLLDGNASFKTMREKKHQIAWSAWGAQFRPQYWGQYHSANAHKPQTNNFSNMDDKKLDRIIVKYRDGFKKKDRVRWAHEIQKMIYESASYTPTFIVPYFRTAYWRYWRFPETPATKMSASLFDWIDEYNEANGGLFWLDMDRKKETKEAMKSGKKFPAKTVINDKFKI